jgi:hypothetical protein
LKIKGLRDVSKTLKIKELNLYTKATPKPHQNSKPLKIKHLTKFFGVLGVI